MKQISKFKLLNGFLAFITVFGLQCITALPSYAGLNEYVPFVKLQIKIDTFSVQVESILNNLTPKLEEIVNSTPIPVATIGASNNSEKNICPSSNPTLKYDSQKDCLYLPEIFFEKSLSFKELTRSFSVQLALEGAKLENFKIGNISVFCDSSDALFQKCNIKAKIQQVTFAGNLTVYDANRQNMLFTTTSLQKLRLNKDQQGEIEFTTQVAYNNTNQKVIQIAPHSLHFNLEGKNISAVFSNEIENLDLVTFKYFEQKLDAKTEIVQLSGYPSKGTFKEKYSFAKRAGYQKFLDQLFESSFSLATRDYNKNEFLVQLLADTNLPALYFDQIWHDLEPLLTEKLEPIIESSIPVKKQFEVELPVTPINTAQNIERYDEIIQLLKTDLERSAIIFSQNETADNLVRQYSKWLENISQSWAARLKGLNKSYEAQQLSQLILIQEEYTQSFLKCQSIANSASTNCDKNKNDFSIIKNLIINTIAQMTQNISGTERVMDLKLHKIVKSKKDKFISILLSGRIDGIPSENLNTIENMQDLDYGFQFNEAPSKQPAAPTVQDFAEANNSDLIVQFDVGNLNQYLKLLHSKGYFNFCKTESKEPGSQQSYDCDEMGTIGNRNYLVLENPPQIVFDSKSQKYFLEISNVKNNAIFILNTPILNRFFSDKFDVRVSIGDMNSANNNFLNRDDIKITSSLKGSMSPELLLSSLILPIQSVITTSLIKMLTHSLIQQIILDGQKHSISEIVNNKLNKLDFIKTKQIFIRNNILTYMGSIDP